MLEQMTIADKTSEDRFSECGFFLPGIGYGPHSDKTRLSGCGRLAMFLLYPLIAEASN
jgi:hypothetical protein